MDALRIATALALASAPMAAHADTRVWNLGRFDAVALASSYDVEIINGSEASRVEATGDADTINSIRVERHGEGIMISSERRSGWNWSGGSNPKIRVFTPSLRACSVAGSGSVRVNEVRGDSFASSVAGSGDLRIDDVAVGVFAASIAGSGEMRASGRCDMLKASISGSGEARLEDLSCNTAKVSVMGSGAVAARARAEAHVSAMGSGAVRIYGRAKCKVSKMGSAQVACD